jgi:hypothetical protein
MAGALYEPFGAARQWHRVVECFLAIIGSAAHYTGIVEVDNVHELIVAADNGLTRIGVLGSVNNIARS